MLSLHNAGPGNLWLEAVERVLQSALIAVSLGLSILAHTVDEIGEEWGSELKYIERCGYLFSIKLLFRYFSPLLVVIVLLSLV